MITIRTSRHRPDQMFWLADPGDRLPWLTTSPDGFASWLPAVDERATQPALVLRKADLPRIAQAIDVANADGLSTLKALRALLDAVETPDPRPGPTTRPNTSSGAGTAFRGHSGAISRAPATTPDTAPDSRDAHATPPAGATP